MELEWPTGVEGLPYPQVPAAPAGYATRLVVVAWLLKQAEADQLARFVKRAQRQWLRIVDADGAWRCAQPGLLRRSPQRGTGWTHVTLELCFDE
jgi:hypothetical protein